MHTTHCSPNGEILISVLGDVDGKGKGDFLVIDEKSLKIKGKILINLYFRSNDRKLKVDTHTGTWVQGQGAKFGYDFWYQPYHDVLIASEWGAPSSFKSGFQEDHAFNTSI